jgi:hypothetical protein
MLLGLRIGECSEFRTKANTHIAYPIIRLSHVITIIRIANKAMPTALKLLVEFIEQDVTQQWRKRASLRSPKSLIEILINCCSLLPVIMIPEHRRRRYSLWRRVGRGCGGGAQTRRQPASQKTLANFL